MSKHYKIRQEIESNKQSQKFPNKRQDKFSQLVPMFVESHNSA